MKSWQIKAQIRQLNEKLAEMSKVAPSSNFVSHGQKWYALRGKIKKLEKELEEISWHEFLAK